MLTDVPGVRVGHWTDPIARTGCTVVLFPEGTVASGEVRGGAPATREFALLDPQRSVDRVNAVVLSGGSVFGLAAADGVVRWLRDQGTGFSTPAGPVPIVVGMSLFDLMVGEGSVRPGADKGYRACNEASAGPVALGAVGAGTGAMVGLWRGLQNARPGGIVTASVTQGEVVVAALIAVNAFGDVDDGSGMASDDAALAGLVGMGGFSDIATGDHTPRNTVIGVVVTNARLDKMGCHIAAQGGHDGLARSIFPPHSTVDGDAIVAAATCEVDSSTDLVRAMAVLAVERAIRSLS